MAEFSLTVLILIAQLGIFGVAPILALAGILRICLKRISRWFFRGAWALPYPVCVAVLSALAVLVAVYIIIGLQFSQLFAV